MLQKLRKNKLLLIPLILLFLCSGVLFVGWFVHIDVEETEDVTLELEESPDSKILVFSDSHLTCDYDEKEDLYLKKIIEPADLVIMNGDIWDGYVCDFDEFIEGDYQELFAMLKDRNAIYIYGNHDVKQFSDERVDRFSSYSADKLKLTVGENVYYFEHGNGISPSLEERYPYFLRSKLSIQAGGKLESLGKSIFGDRYFEIFYGSENNRHREYALENLGKNEVLFTGHTHTAELDLDSHFANDGLIRHGYGSYIYIQGDSIQLFQEDY